MKLDVFIIGFTMILNQDLFILDSHHFMCENPSVLRTHRLKGTVTKILLYGDGQCMWHKEIFSYHEHEGFIILGAIFYFMTLHLNHWGP